MANVIEQSLAADDLNFNRSAIKQQMLSFQQMLIHDITNQAFADIYAQTIAYGMFAARYHDPSLPTFSREEAATLIPKSNPFLRKLFQDIAGYDLDHRLVWIVDELVSIFLASDVADIMKNFGKSTKQEDPVVHFYETFLAAYNPALRKARGVWYTPQPVVNFIVRAVDDILKTEFNLPQGLADTSKIKIKKKAVTQTGTGANSKIKEVYTEQEVHKVQILDPATGTGTFLAEVVKHIYQKFEGQQGIWSKYVTNDLIPRLNGFELLMASYAMAHLKMDMLLTETGYKPTDDQRFRIFLTNSLEEAHPDTQTLFSSWLSDEADQANAIKRDAPVMVVMGNPPYSVSSSNKSPWIEKLTADYKRDLNERNIQPLSDDYIKFIRFGQYFIDKNGSGILAYISNNSFIDGIIHLQMRKHLLESFDKIYILDLHGNSKKKEVSPDGSTDQNVFDIMQGVSINIFIKTSLIKKNKFGEVFHYDLQGKRDFKYDYLNSNTLNTINWKRVEVSLPELFYVSKNNSLKLSYNNGFEINKIFPKGASGVKTERDSLNIHFDNYTLDELLIDLKTLSSTEFRIKYNEGKDGRDWKLEAAMSDVKNNVYKKINVQYKPFDFRKTLYTGTTKGFAAYPRNDISKHFVFNENIGFVCMRKLVNTQLLSSILLTKNTIDLNFYGFQTYFFPLYLYPDTNAQQSAFESAERVPNLNMEIVTKMATDMGLYFTPEESKGTTVETNQLTPLNILDYIYAVLHSPKYREKYKEFLKIDFPRVPYPKDQKTFFDLVDLGSQLREIHLLESPIVTKYITQYPEDGDNIVSKPLYKDGKVYINETQYFANVPEVAWNFYIGGYQPAQKWLKDRKGRELSTEDLFHYQKIIVALTKTEGIMGEIDKIDV
jgi:predicted helicase